MMGMEYKAYFVTPIPVMMVYTQFMFLSSDSEAASASMYGVDTK